jgi:hypothetical protein
MAAAVLSPTVTTFVTITGEMALVGRRQVKVNCPQLIADRT